MAAFALPELPPDLAAKAAEVPGLDVRLLMFIRQEVALNGQTTHLVTYDEDLENVGVFYPEFSTCRPLEFLAALRVPP